MANIYYDADASLELVKDKVVAIIGYGNQGRSQALNMKDSGVQNVIIGSVRDQSWEQARKDGFEAYPIEEASQKADIIFMLLPDEIAPSIYNEKIRPYLEEGNVLNFSSGYNVTYNYIEFPEYVDVVMVAPRMIGKGVRELYLSGEGFPSFVAVHQDYSGKAKEIALGLAKAIGSTKKGAIEVTFDDETYLDLFAEQITWPLIMNVLSEVYKAQVAAGHPEEAVLMELYLSKEPVVMFEKMADMGLFKQLPLHSRTSQYGQLTGFKSVDPTFIKEFIQQRYEKIRSGSFADEWTKEQQNGLTTFNQLLKDAMSNDISKAEERLHERLNTKKSTIS
jgi:ketol-acid reductoisomerase